MHDTTLTALTLLFFASEVVLALSRRSRSTGGATRADRGSSKLLGIVITLAILAAFSLAGYRPGRIGAPWAWIRAAAMTLLVGGLAFRWWAVIALGKYFTVDVATHHDHALIEAGPFRLVRHPSYTGLLLTFLGLGLSLGNVASVLALMVPILMVFAYRIRVEEAALRRSIGPSYDAYCARTKRLIPGII